MTYYLKTMVITIAGCMSIISCRTLPLMEYPPVPVTYNYYEYFIQNMDEEGQCDMSTLTAQYDGFNVRYYMNSSGCLTLTIENKANRSLIFDKSKCYVLYNGYSRELFKDVRTGKVTTFNNVQDAINNVQTNESSVTFSVPPYSKWDLIIPETNLQTSVIPPTMIWDVGNHPLTPFTTYETVEFILPYTFDYTLTDWHTSRNRVYAGNVRVEKKMEHVDHTYSQSTFQVVNLGSSNVFAYRAQVNPNEIMADYIKAYNYNQKAMRINYKRGMMW